MPKTFRNVTIRISALNHATKDNEILGIKAGDEVRYTLKDILNVLEDWSDKKDIKYYAIEHNEDPDNIHYHVVISFPKDSVCTFETLKNKFPYGDIEGCKYGVKSCVQYLIHMNNPEKFQYDWSDVVTNAPDKLEDYKIPGKATMNAKLKNTIDKILSGEIKECDKNRIDPYIYLKHKRLIENAFELYIENYIKNHNRHVKVVYLQGPAGVGKTSFTKILAEEHNLKICFSAGGGGKFSFENVKPGFDVLVLDDIIFEDFKIQTLLDTFDPHNLASLPARYHNRTFTGNLIMICSNIPLLETFADVPYSVRKALFRRFSCVVDFGTSVDGVTEYTINEVVEVEDEVTHNKKCVLTCKDDDVCLLDLNKYYDLSTDDKMTDEFVQMVDAL